MINPTPKPYVQRISVQEMLRFFRLMPHQRPEDCMRVFTRREELHVLIVYNHPLYGDQIIDSIVRDTLSDQCILQAEYLATELTTVDFHELVSVQIFTASKVP